MCVSQPLPDPSRWDLRIAEEEAGRVFYLADRAPGPSCRWALLADSHVSADPHRYVGAARAERHLSEAVEQIIRADPDGVLINGDLAWEEGLDADYGRIQSILKPLIERFAVVIAPGNHDRREGLLQSFGQFEGTPPLKTLTVVECGPVRLMALDSLYRTDVVPGLLGKAQRTWLDRFWRKSSPRPTALFVHHPLDDEDGSLLDGDRLAALAAGRCDVIFTGHDHAFRRNAAARPPVVAMPAVGLPFTVGEAVGWLLADFSRQGAIIELRAVGDIPEEHPLPLWLPWVERRQARLE